MEFFHLYLDTLHCFQEKINRRYLRIRLGWRVIRGCVSAGLLGITRGALGAGTVLWFRAELRLDLEEGFLLFLGWG